MEMKQIMIDRHVHIERGPYTKEWMKQFVDQAKQMGITQLFVVEHTHRFEEFKELYQSIFKEPHVAKQQTEWFYKGPKLKLQEYIQFSEEMKNINWDIELKFGLEVCYFPEKEDFLRQSLKSYKWDFLIGSVHFIEGWGFDNPHTKYIWDQKNIDDTYQKYYIQMIQLIESQLFDTLAHPDSIKCMNYYPKYSLTDTYIKLAKALKNNHMKTEFSSGLYINYHHTELGMNRELLKILRNEQVEIVTVSDAHRPEDVGKYIKEGIEIIRSY